MLAPGYNELREGESGPLDSIVGDREGLRATQNGAFPKEVWVQGK